MTASSWAGASASVGSALTAVALGVSDAASACAGAGGGDAGAGAVSARDAEDARDADVARDEAPVAEPGEETGTSATTAVRSMRPRLTLSSGDRNREPSHRKM